MQDDDSDDGQVIFSFSVISDTPIAALEGLPGRERPAEPDDEFHYSVWHVDFEEPAWDPRAERVDAMIQDAVAALRATGVGDEVLGREDVLVRAFFTFPRGAETLSAEAVRLLADCRATIWLDFLP